MLRVVTSAVQGYRANKRWHWDSSPGVSGVLNCYSKHVIQVKDLKGKSLALWFW